MGAAILHTLSAREELVAGLYSAADAVIAGELQRLREQGVVPSCHAGCSTCCAQHIVTNRLEVHAIAGYIRRRFGARRIEALRRRVLEWNRWEDAGRSGSVQPGPNHRRCPLLEDERCSIYPVRPLICRAHFASSDPAWCRPAVGADAREGRARVLESVRAAAAPFKRRIADQVDRELAIAGLSREDSVALLPPGLADEMGWGDRLR
jgi:Fe-S-cluster containining protein